MNKPWYIRKWKWDKEQGHIAVRSDIANKPETVVFEYLYNRLNILDAKVAALLTFNSILLAAASLVWSKIVERPGATPPIFLYVAALAWLASTLICLSISFLKWEHLDPNEDNDHYRDKIIIVTVRRTCAYNFAVALILFALIVFVLMWVGLSI